MARPLRIALTGGIGTGKSTVASTFQALGVPIIDSDIISRAIVKPGSASLEAITKEFGNDVLCSDGRLNRSKLRDIVFDNLESKKKLEEILHPVIYREIEDQINSVKYPYCLIVIPLLIETDSKDKFDRILVVDIPEDIQIKRTAERDKTTSMLIENIIKNQASREQRLKYADDVIDNNQEINDLSKTVMNLHKKYLKLSHQ
jgi:dephospho-CoA kinase